MYPPHKGAPLLLPDAVLLLSEQDDAAEQARLSRRDPQTGVEIDATIPLSCAPSLVVAPGGCLIELSYLPEALEDPDRPFPHDACFSVFVGEGPAKTLAICPDAPERAIEACITVAATRIESAQAALRAALQRGHDGDWASAIAEIRTIIGVRALRREVQARLQKLPVDTPLYSYARLFGAGPEDEVVPALIVATNKKGEYTLLDLRSGTLARTHHDNFDEYGGEYRSKLERAPSQFLSAFVKRYRIGYA